MDNNYALEDEGSDLTEDGSDSIATVDIYELLMNAKTLTITFDDEEGDEQYADEAGNL